MLCVSFLPPTPLALALNWCLGRQAGWILSIPEITPALLWGFVWHTVLELRRPACLCFPSPEIKDVRHHVQYNMLSPPKIEWP